LIVTVWTQCPKLQLRIEPDEGDEVYIGGH
jgi:hypothetical protein